MTMDTWKKLILEGAIRIQTENWGLNLNFFVFQRFFRIMVAYLSLKNARLPTFFFFDSNNPCKELPFPRSQNVLGGTILNSQYGIDIDVVTHKKTYFRACKSSKMLRTFPPKNPTFPPYVNIISYTEKN